MLHLHLIVNTINNLFNSFLSWTYAGFILLFLVDYVLHLAEHLACGLAPSF